MFDDTEREQEQQRSSLAQAISALHRELSIPDMVVTALAEQGISANIVTGGFYPVGYQVGNTTYYPA